MKKLSQMSKQEILDRLSVYASNHIESIEIDFQKGVTITLIKGWQTADGNYTFTTLAELKNATKKDNMIELQTQDEFDLDAVVEAVDQAAVLNSEDNAIEDVLKSTLTIYRDTTGILDQGELVLSAKELRRVFKPEMSYDTLLSELEEEKDFTVIPNSEDYLITKDGAESILHRYNAKLAELYGATPAEFCAYNF